jgi:hypothetical protein
MRGIKILHYWSLLDWRLVSKLESFVWHKLSLGLTSIYPSLASVTVTSIKKEFNISHMESTTMKLNTWVHSHVVSEYRAYSPFPNQGPKEQFDWSARTGIRESAGGKNTIR